ncbi:MAG: hypothetical protein COS99_01990 [Candidatus Omnitrophica bacterium CG07_land_8_20_14_0_80_42_15]|uniref:Class I SAM-dependent methyltransferase n=1 Tax=Candidatus Aquitaenariimonas noxiae TaxID=1974741 RepID=A0A2J0L085_9BACT|nr:MAG: hypothetical protein COS99_01990 [Candidatus Omnitrophica bacterium CG07_land_8_20_14_0_80_42_15]
MSDMIKRFIYHLRGLDAFFETKGTTGNVRGFMEQSECKALFFAAKSAPGDGVVVEIGSYVGKSTIWMAKALKARQRGKMYAIDPHTGDPYSDVLQNERKQFALGQEGEFRKNISDAAVQDVVIPIVKTSEEASVDFDKPIRLIFIDGIHEYDFVKTDFLLWSPKVIENGIIAFHDSLRPGVKRVFEELLYNSKSYELIGRVYYTSFFRKKGKRRFTDMMFDLRFDMIFPQYQGNKKIIAAALNFLAGIISLFIF